jgi:anthranilate phosphoribosyltransferase
MSNEFRELLKRVGSGTHTSKNLTRAEAARATEMMLLQLATPAQIGAFMIAHRIKRPTSEELAGILDVFTQLGNQLTICPAHQYPPVVLGTPYDGRSRTVPVSIITALILAMANVPVVLHGGECMPTKYGMSLIEIWRQLGVDYSTLNLAQTQRVYEQTNLGLVYLPEHFPAAHNFVTFREEIGKRPPFATAELVWCPIAGEAQIVAGFVHPPTEARFRETFKLRETKNYTLVKGLEGSCDLSRNRTGIITFSAPEGDFARLLLDPSKYGFNGSDPTFESHAQAIALIQEIIQGHHNQLFPSAIFNGGFYLWHFKITDTLESGFALAEQMLTTGKLASKLSAVKSVVKRERPTNLDALS